MDKLFTLFEESMMTEWIVDFVNDTKCRICSNSMTDKIPVLLFPDNTYKNIEPFTCSEIAKMYDEWRGDYIL